MKQRMWVLVVLGVVLAVSIGQADIIVNEIMQNPSAVSDSDGEWFEIYNSSDMEMNLNGWMFADAGGDTFVVATDLWVGGGAYLVFGNNADANTNGGVTVDYEYANWYLSNSTDEVIVFDASGALVDEAWYDGGAEWPDPSGASMQLTDWTLDNNVGANWLEADLPFGDGDFGTPGALNEWEGGGEPVPATIEEIQTGVYGEGDLVIVTGIVTQGHGTVHTSYVDVYVQDESGYGIMVYDGDPALGEGLDLGDEVEITGEISQYFDTTELINWTFSEISTGNDLPAPITFTTGEFPSQIPWEGVYAELSGELMNEPGAPDESFNITLDDGSGEATVRVWADTEIDMTGFAVGDMLTIRGTVDTYFGECQLQPALQSQIESEPAGPVSLDLIPTQTVVPAEGGNVYYDAHLVSTLPNAYAGVQYWTLVEAPNGNTYGPLYTVNFTLAPFMDITVEDLVQSVPDYAPAGEYTHIGRVGYPAYYVEDSFTFTKEGEAAGSMNLDGWHAGGWSLAGDASEVVTVPSDYALAEPYPNPFNPAANVTVSLPQSAELTVQVFNVMGRQVAELANGQFEAGTHTLTLDGSSLSSGVYFVKATVPGELDAVRKVTLMK
ncbi:MAG: hypothetical protein MAG453_01596 [Calditrichaeota bacterium]|nr:hypothetical protein [Calditrichota bacterium]